MSKYNIEDYWSRVAQKIEKRGENYIGGDDNPFYRYKRQKFLRIFLDTIDFESKAVLEVGFGPGGNLKHIVTHYSPKKIYGADISQNMLEIAGKNLRLCDNVELIKIDGQALPYPDQFMDLSYTVTVLQHNTDEIMFTNIVQELCRVTKATIVIIEDIGSSKTLGGEGSWIARSVDVYKAIFEQNGFKLSNVQYLNTRVSRLWYERVFNFYRKLISKQHNEGDPVGFAFNFIIALPMSITRILDNVFVEDQDLAKLVFSRV